MNLPENSVIIMMGPQQEEYRASFVAEYTVRPHTPWEGLFLEMPELPAGVYAITVTVEKKP